MIRERCLILMKKIVFSLVKDKENKDKKKDADEPPTKKVRRNLQIASDSICEMDEEDLLQSAPLEVTKILRTPHVQKRLNKLLENTPESSPLTSILKVGLRKRRVLDVGDCYYKEDFCSDSELRSVSLQTTAKSGIQCSGSA